MHIGKYPAARVLLGLVALAGLSAVACGGGDVKPTPTRTPAPWVIAYTPTPSPSPTPYSTPTPEVGQLYFLPDAYSAAYLTPTELEYYLSFGSIPGIERSIGKPKESPILITNIPEGTRKIVRYPDYTPIEVSMVELIKSYVDVTGDGTRDPILKYRDSQRVTKKGSTSPYDYPLVLEIIDGSSGKSVFNDVEEKYPSSGVIEHVFVSGGSLTREIIRLVNKKSDYCWNATETITTYKFSGGQFVPASETTFSGVFSDSIFVSDEKNAAARREGRQGFCD